MTLSVDYRKGNVPSWVQEIIDAQLAIEREDAKSAGKIGYMARAMVLATMPYKDPKTDVFSRQNGKFRLRIVAGYDGGIPFGIYPRLLMSWIATEAVRTQSPNIFLGDTLRDFLKGVMELSSFSGGKRGTSTRVIEQMKRLFGSLVTAYYHEPDGKAKKGRVFNLRGIQIAEELKLYEDEFADPPALLAADTATKDCGLWTPQDQEVAGRWHSQVKLTNSFFQECVDNPVPIDLRAYKALRASPLAMDVYTWLTYRMSYTSKRSRPIPWESLMMQFGSNFTGEHGQAVRNFRKGFLEALRMVHGVYNTNIEVSDRGLILVPSATSVAMLSCTQKKLF